MVFNELNVLNDTGRQLAQAANVSWGWGWGEPVRFYHTAFTIIILLLYHIYVRYLLIQ